MTTTTMTTRNIYCTLLCPWPYANYQTCTCDCPPGTFAHNCQPITTTVATREKLRLIEPTKPVLTTTSKPPCALDCRMGFQVTSPDCRCICTEFYRFNGSTCVLNPMFPKVSECKECENKPPVMNRPMRCVKNSFDIFCVP